MRKLSLVFKTLDPKQSAKQIGLRYVNDDEAGILRKRQGKGFVYVNAKNKRVQDKKTLARIKSLVIPPAWTQVWICSDAAGHIQVTGRDARGRKQYRYHAEWRQTRDEAKYTKVIAFGLSLPKIRAATEKHLRLTGLPREKVLATVVRLLEGTLIRVGNEEYAKQNASFGLTTMQDRHVRISGSEMRFSFRGKSGIKHAIDLSDRRLAKIVKSCQSIPGQDLFQYLDDDGKRQSISSVDVNAYIRDISEQDFTAKDFRTWAGTVLAARALQEFSEFDNETQAKRHIVAAIERVAKRLGNTKAICRKCYVHPAVLDGYLDGTLLQTLSKKVERELREHLHQLNAEEAAVLAFLQQQLKVQKKAA